MAPHSNVKTRLSASLLNSRFSDEIVKLSFYNTSKVEFVLRHSTSVQEIVKRWYDYVLLHMIGIMLRFPYIYEINN